MAAAAGYADADMASVTARLLELAADDAADALRGLLASHPSLADEPSPWYSGRSTTTELLTPLMVAAAYGSVACLDLLLSPPHLADPNRACAVTLSTPLHLAASGGAPAAAPAVSRLLAAGADPSLLDALGRRPCDVVSVPPNSHHLKLHLQNLLGLASSPPMSPVAASSGGGRKEWPADPSLPDIKNGAYASDDFRMYSFKVRACSRAYSHDWTECPFVHPGENARRRDPRKYHYSCVPCPEFRKGGGCRRGDLCEYAHGVFECWLHPAQYRTRLCKDGVSCARRVCFFAHTPDELRPLYVSTGSAVPSPRSAASAAAAMEMAAAAMGLVAPGSPNSPFTPPLSPSGSNGMAGWPQPNVPALHLPGSSTNLQLSRLRTSLSARDMPVDEFFAGEYDGRVGSPAAGGNGLRSARGKALMPSNLDELFSVEMAASLSPRYAAAAEQGGAIFSPTHKTAMFNQFQQQQSMLSPINTGASSLFQSSSALGVSSPGQMSPRSAAAVPAEPVSPMSSRLLAALAQREKQQQQTLRSLSSRDLGAGASLIVGSPVGSNWSKWGLPSGAPDWGVDGEELGRLKRSSSFELRSGANGDEPDLSWVNSLVKEPTPEKLAGTGVEAMEPNGISAPMVNGEGIEGEDDAAVLGAWLDQLQLDQMVV